MPKVKVEKESKKATKKTDEVSTKKIKADTTVKKARVSKKQAV